MLYALSWGGKKMVEKIESLVFTEVKPGFFIFKNA
jgi:hypothetical protein